jgi:hypothetical protein
VKGTEELGPDSAKGLKMVAGVMPVFEELTVPTSSGETVPLKSPESSCAVGTLVRLFWGEE